MSGPWDSASDALDRGADDARRTAGWTVIKPVQPIALPLPIARAVRRSWLARLLRRWPR